MKQTDKFLEEQDASILLEEEDFFNWKQLEKERAADIPFPEPIM